MKVLSLDQSTSTGWAYTAGGMDKIEWGRFKIPKADPLVNNLPERLLAFGQGVKNRVEHFRPELVVYETAIFPAGGRAFNVDTITLLQKLAGIVDYICAEAGVEVESYASTTWKKHFIGYGVKPKGAPDNHMKIASARRCKMLGYNIKSHDEADAIGLLHFVIHGRPGSIRRQGELLDMVRERL